MIPAEYFSITMPPLRECLDDIPLLVNFYIDRISRRLGKVIKVIPAGVMDALQQNPWPGNVRELKNVLERAVINSSGPKLRLVDELKPRQSDPATKHETLEAVGVNTSCESLSKLNGRSAGKTVRPRSSASTAAHCERGCGNSA
jgi:DNA-binding NtrC family response regulator